MFPKSTSSRLGKVAAVMETVSPSQLSPAVIHNTWTSLTAGSRSARTCGGADGPTLPGLGISIMGLSPSC
jgi:hypothetical protein